MSRTIVVTSGKGGVGKTTVTVNIAIKLASKGASVIVVDADIGLNNVDVVLGIESKVMYDLVDVLEMKCRINEALVQDDFLPNLYILSSGKTGIAVENLTELRLLTERLSEIFDYVLIDCPAGVDIGFFRAVNSAREAIVVATPHLASIRDADKVLSYLSTYDIREVGLVVNRARGDLMLKGEILSASEISNSLRTKILGVIPEDDVIATINRQSTSFPTSRAGMAFDLLVDNIVNGEGRIYDCTKRYRGVKGKLRLLLNTDRR